MGKPELTIAGCSYEAAKVAITRWHYSRAMPSSKLVRFGVWEDGRFVGAIIYGVGANRHLASPFGLQPTEACELVRVALAPGTIYQATNFVYLGPSKQPYLKILGEIVHPRTAYDRYGPGGQSVATLRRTVDPNARRVEMPAKLKYVYPFDRMMRRMLQDRAMPYPTRSAPEKVQTEPS